MAVRVLLIDDSEDDCALVRSHFSRFGGAYQLSCVSTYEHGLRELRAGPHDVALIDHQLGPLTGLELVRAAAPYRHRMPVVMLTGQLDRELELAGVRAGATSFLEKSSLNHQFLEHAVHDALERRKLECRVLLADRLASVGALVSGVAHEICNPLAYILANVDALASYLTELAPSAPADLLVEMSEALRDVKEGANRVNAMVIELKKATRVQENQLPVDVNGVLETAAAMSHGELKTRARLVRNLRPVPSVCANEGRLMQVFLHLLANAAQAIPANTQGQEVRLGSSIVDGRVIIEVQDTGSGISSEVRQKLFTPFFTTKPVGSGSGLGLYISQNIIMAMGGEITFDSVEGHGATFRVALPACA